MCTSSKIIEQTRIFNHISNGWTGETITKDKSGQIWEINTLKTYGGKITSTAIEIDEAKKEKGMQTIVISNFISKPKKRLIASSGRATEKKIREQHAKAVLLFDEQDESTPKTTQQKKIENPIKRGLIIFMWGYNKESQKLVLTEEYRGGWKFINLSTFQNGYAEHIRPYSQKFGIGYYYLENPLNYLDEDGITNAMIENKKLLNQIAEQANKAKEIRESKIKEGLPKLCIPHYAQSIIVAELMQNDSDLMTDYHAKSTKKVVYLAWSQHKRNDFKEMRKAAAKFEETKHFFDDKNKDHEHRENYTGGSGYYLAVNSYSGWQVSKESYLDLKSEQFKETLAIAIAENRFLCDDEPENKKAVEPLTVADGVELLEYSEKSFILIGNTKPYKEILGRNGLKLKFNSRLTHPTTGNKICGWVIPTKRIDEVKQALNL